MTSSGSAPTSPPNRRRFIAALPIGIAIGTALGVATKQIAIGVALGVAIGLALSRIPLARGN